MRTDFSDRPGRPGRGGYCWHRKHLASIRGPTVCLQPRWALFNVNMNKVGLAWLGVLSLSRICEEKAGEGFISS